MNQKHLITTVPRIMLKKRRLKEISKIWVQIAPGFLERVHESGCIKINRISHTAGFVKNRLYFMYSCK